MPRALSTYVVLMDFQQGNCGANNICVHRNGGLAAMRAWQGRTCDGSVAGWKASDFTRDDVEPITMLDLVGNDLSGTIAKLTYARSMPTNVQVVQP